MQTKIDIINLALGNLSNTNFIESLEENNPEAIQAKLRWDGTVDIVLADFAWSFASRRHSLTSLAEQPEGESHYLYPADCIKIRRLYSPLNERQKIPFRIGRSLDNKFKTVIAPCNPASAEYTTRDVSVSEWPAGFANAVGWRLAAEIALASTAEHNLANAMLQSYAYQIGQAKLFDAEERGEMPPNESDWIKARNV